MEHSEELACLDQIVAGDDCIILQRRYRPRLLWFARMMGVPAQDCADVVQEVLLIAIRNVRTGQFNRDSSLITWLDGILKHKVCDLWRARTKQQDLFIECEPASVDEESAQEYASSTSRRWDRDIDVRRVLDRMPHELSALLLLNESEGLTLSEIARKWKRPPGTLGRKLAEAKSIFRRQVGISRKTTTRAPRKSKPAARRASVSAI